MLEKPKKLKKSELNRLFLYALRLRVLTHSGECSAPLLVDLKSPLELRLRVFLFNCTNPPGGRRLDEYKIQIILPGQTRGDRGRLDYSDGRLPILAAYVNEGTNGIFILWDADKHEDFAYSTNMQVKSEAIIGALSSRVSKTRRNNNEIIVAARPEYLYDAIRCRIDIMREDILRGEV